jgi:DnaJ family protein A protein 5
MQTYDPVFDDADTRVLAALGCGTLPENRRGEHTLDPATPHLVYMPHCSRALYEALLSANYTRMRTAPPVILLGNDLGDYIPGFVRDLPAAAEPATEAFEPAKPKKKRRNRTGPAAPVVDSVLRRLVPHFSVLMLSDLPETHLPGFARAFLSMGFQWLEPAGAEQVDWETPLPAVEWPEDGEVL